MNKKVRTTKDVIYLNYMIVGFLSSVTTSVLILILSVNMF